jgi:hypothetical protein
LDVRVRGVFLTTSQELKSEMGERFGLAHLDDRFVGIAVLQLSAVKDERVLIRYLHGMKLFSRLHLSKVEAERLKSELYGALLRGCCPLYALFASALTSVATGMHGQSLDLRIMCLQRRELLRGKRWTLFSPLASGREALSRLGSAFCSPFTVVSCGRNGGIEVVLTSALSSIAIASCLLAVAALLHAEPQYTKDRMSGHALYCVTAPVLSQAKRCRVPLNVTAQCLDSLHL